MFHNNVIAISGTTIPEYNTKESVFLCVFSIFYFCFSCVTFLQCVGFIFIHVSSIQLYSCKIFNKLFTFQKHKLTVQFSNMFCTRTNDAIGLVCVLLSVACRQFWFSGSFLFCIDAKSLDSDSTVRKFGTPDSDFGSKIRLRLRLQDLLCDIMIVSK